MHKNYRKNKENLEEKKKKKSAQNTFAIFTNSVALCGTIWSTLARTVALYNQDTTTQSLFFLFYQQNF